MKKTFSAADEAVFLLPLLFLSTLNPTCPTQPPPSPSSPSPTASQPFQTSAGAHPPDVARACSCMRMRNGGAGTDLRCVSRVMRREVHVLRVMRSSGWLRALTVIRRTRIPIPR
ncbi:hypothetical protein FA15DRAFT_674114 [Coprinopsis marcescibilis]|uniref:Secreted protein n=1 Tax=Coprinopsis marcescibilis TaxID=230819 RepID=A0A5C3KIV0_COPMA|nr:hypothetical protein FA15DRAFT_674114 [Coprinopsis marcescibilis]